MTRELYFSDSPYEFILGARIPGRGLTVGLPSRMRCRLRILLSSGFVIDVNVEL